MTVVIVAGGATGIGAATVRGLRARGDTVVLVDRNAGAARTLLAEDAPGAARLLVADLAGTDWAEEAVALALDHGGLDAVFYNAAVLEARPLAAWDPDAWDRSMAVNLRAPFLLVRAAAPALRRAPHGRVLLTASTGALRGHAGMPAYHATKAGLLGLVRALADELGPDGVTVNALCPGWVDTPFNDAFWAHQDDPDRALADLLARIPLRRQATPAELVDTVLFLLSPSAAYLTGQSVVVDGGYTAV